MKSQQTSHASPISAASGDIRRDVRPPITPDSAPQSGAAEGPVPTTPPRLRRTVRPRPIVTPGIWETDEPGHRANSKYVRTFWTAVLGPGAVADLLRLATAASRGRSLRRPVNLSLLCAAGLARHHDGRVEVRAVVPPLSRQQLRELPPAIRRMHAAEAA